MKDLSGQKFGRWMVLKREHRKGWYWLCRCTCGTEKAVFGGNLTAGRTGSCGCALAEKARQQFTKHGHSVGGRRSPLFGVWHTMLQRCTNPKHTSFANYGGRGITVCPRWHRFEAFLEDMAAGYRGGLQIDRRDNDGPYSPDNCRWVTPKVNRSNRRDSKRRS